MSIVDIFLLSDSQVIPYHKKYNDKKTIASTEMRLLCQRHVVPNYCFLTSQNCSLLLSLQLNLRNQLLKTAKPCLCNQKHCQLNLPMARLMESSGL